MFTIDKEISFDYGHRVWTQKLNKEFSVDDACVCRHLHGHRGKVHIFLESEELDPQGMVTDFKHLSWLKKFLDEYVDHKFLIDKQDPLFDILTTMYEDGSQAGLNIVYVPDTPHSVGYTLDLGDLEPGTPDYEYYESFFVVDFIPTSENLSKWLWEIANAKMQKLGVKVSRVDWWETPKSKSTYQP